MAPPVPVASDTIETGLEAEAPTFVPKNQKDLNEGYKKDFKNVVKTASYKHAAFRDQEKTIKDFIVKYVDEQSNEEDSSALAQVVSDL